MKTCTVLGFAAVAVSAVSAKIVSECTIESNAWVVVRGNLSDYKKIGKAGDKKIAFIVNSASLPQAKPVAKKFGDRAIVWELNKDDLKAAKSLRKKSKKLNAAVKKMLKSYKKQTGKKARFVSVPKGTCKKIVKAFEKRDVAVVRAARTVTTVKKTKKLISKAKKNKKKSKTIPGGVVFFTVDGKNDVKQLKKLRKALNAVNGKNCFKAVPEEIEMSASEESEGEEGPLKAAAMFTEEVQVNAAELSADESSESSDEEEVVPATGGAVSMAVNGEAAVDAVEQVAVVEQANAADAAEQVAVVGQASAADAVEQAAEEESASESESESEAEEEAAAVAQVENVEEASEAAAVVQPAAVEAEEVVAEQVNSGAAVNAVDTEASAEVVNADAVVEV